MSNSLNSELYLSTHYLKNPHIKYSNYIKLLNDNPKMYIISSKYCVYTNNPTIMSVDFFKKI